MMKKIITALCCLALLTGCAETNKDDTTAASVQGIDMRISDGYIEYVDSDGDWQKLIALSEMEGTDGEDGQDGTDDQSGKAGTNGSTGATGPIGVAGAQGNSGAVGQNGTNGKDGKDGANGTDGTQVTIDENGILYLDGVRTSWKLVKVGDAVIPTITLGTTKITYLKQNVDTLRIKWNEVENAAYYHVYVNGDLVMAVHSITYKISDTYAEVKIPRNITSGDVTVEVCACTEDYLKQVIEGDKASSSISVAVERYDSITNLKAENSDENTIHVSWDAVNNASEYIISFGTKEVDMALAWPYTVNKTEYTRKFYTDWFTDGGDTDYVVNVYATDPDGKIGDSPVASTTVTVNVIPDKPYRQEATPTPEETVSPVVTPDPNDQTTPEPLQPDESTEADDQTTCQY